MRYWIWWNDIAQGPFEEEELTSLKAFDENLLVCMEDRQDWIPAGRVADLSSAIEHLRNRRNAPRPTPPPPPKNAPIVQPLQGEFFSEPPEQGSLLDSEDSPKGPYAFYPVSGDFAMPTWSIAPVRTTMPIKFPTRGKDGKTVVIELPVQPAIPVVPIITESPVRKEAVQEAIPIRIVETAPERMPEPVLVSQAPALEEPKAAPVKLHWLPWILGATALLVGLGTLVYWWMDRASTRAAIAEAIHRPRPVVTRPVVVQPPPVKQPPVKAKAPAAKKKPPVVKKAAPKPKPVLPGLMPPDPAPVKEPEPVIVPEVVSTPRNVWAEKQTDAIDLVTNKYIPGSKVTIKNQAKSLLDRMHEKELLHAAETGQRLYLPDKISWAALQEEGPRYRVYINFLAWQASGERVQTRSYQFLVDVQKKTVKPEDAATEEDLFRPSAEVNLKQNAMALDIESILGGVDHYNKQKMRSMIVKNNRKNRDEQKNIHDSLQSAKGKVQRAIVYFRKTYTDKALQNLGKAYQFEELLKG